MRSGGIDARWLFLGFFVFMMFIMFGGLNCNSSEDSTPITKIIAGAEEGTIKRIEVKGSSVKAFRGQRTENPDYEGTIGENTDILALLAERGVQVGCAGCLQVEFKKSGGGFAPMLIAFLPLILFGGLMFFIFSRASSSGGGIGGIAKSRARMQTIVPGMPTVTFRDVAGVDEAKFELEEIVEFLKFPQRFLAVGAKIPKGVLLMGPPGTGKTLLAKAVAGEAGVPFFSISGSEFVEMFVGVGAARVRDLFDQAKRNAPCILFVDEIDAVGRHRGAGLGGGHDEREQTLNQILVEMDGFEPNTSIIVIAATNRPDILDPALLRPGRFDRRTTLDLPDVEGRKAILKVHSAGKPLGPGIDLQDIARQTSGFSGADIANLVNEAAILTARAMAKNILMSHFEEAIDRILMGLARKSRVVNAREKEMTAYHEAGHALVAKHSEHADKVRKISIIARGSSGGHTSMLPSEDRYLWTKNQFNDRLSVAMGGRVAEELIFGEVTTGASSDIEMATKIAQAMIKRYGMSDSLGVRTFGKRQESIFLGREISEEQDYGEIVAEKIDDEIGALLDGAYKQAEEILTARKSELVRLAEYLIEKETISGEEMDALLA